MSGIIRVEMVVTPKARARSLAWPHPSPVQGVATAIVHVCVRIYSV